MKIEKSEDLLEGYSNIKVLLNCFFTSSQDYVGGNLKKTIEKDFKKNVNLKPSLGQKCGFCEFHFFWKLPNPLSMSLLNIKSIWI